MTSHQFIVRLRWLLVPVAAAIGIITAFVPSLIVTLIIGDILSIGGRHVPGKNFLICYIFPTGGAFAAFFFVLFGTWAAPKHGFIVALVLLIIGGVYVWNSVGQIYVPISFQSPPEGQPHRRMWEAIIGTYSGGVIACVMVYFRAGLRRLFRFKHS